MYGAQVASKLRDRFPDCRRFGLGGERMRAAGVELFADISRTAVVGPFEAIGHFAGLFQLFRRLTARIESHPRPVAAIFIDFPDFNMRLARRAKAAGIPVIYYISPQIWAWRPGRVRELREIVDRMLVILPFEADIYREAGVEVEFVGHPLVDTVQARLGRDAFLARYGLDVRRPVVAILPGSRRKELRYILPTVLRGADRILEAKPDTQFVLPVASGLDPDYVRGFLGDRPVTLVVGDTYEAIRYARAAVVASGTATLETALLGTPQVIVYRIGRATWWLGKLMLRVRMFGLVNIILGEEIVPELFQDRLTPENVARETVRLMDDVWAQSRIRSHYERVRRQLGGGDVASRVVDAVESAVARAGAERKALSP
jgi:lipid-A-disaccharide synthase